MVTSRQRRPLVRLPLAGIMLWLSLAAIASVFAQPTTDNAATSTPPASEQGRKGANESAPAAKKEDSPPRGNNSPFDYRASEEISEDLPVSFPVDI